jgi:hypothetical protein
MERRIYHGDLTPDDLARSMVGYFDRGNLAVQLVGDRNRRIVQVATRQRPASGGQTALTITLQRVEDGVAVDVSKQAWLGVAASLGMTALAAWRNPLNLLGRLDDLAQDIENLQLTEEVWRVIENAARMHGAAFELSERLRRLVCEYCQTANPLGEPSCIACGAPLGGAQPITCLNCGFIVKVAETNCPNCGNPFRLQVES